MTENQLYNLFCFVGIINLEGRDGIFDISPDYFKEKVEKFYEVQPKNEFVWGCSHREWRDYCQRWNQDIDDYRLMNLFSFMREVDFDSFGKISEPKEFFPIFDKFFEKDISQISNSTYHRTGTHVILHNWVTKYFKKNSRYIKLLIVSDINPNIR